MSSVVGLSLTGGGARGAYQAGVLLGLAEIFHELKPSQSFPVQAYSGVSAGAINAAYLAAGQTSFQVTTEQLIQLWSQLTPNQVYRTDFLSMSKIGLGWMRDLSFGSAFKKKVATELLNSAPLTDLVNKNIDFNLIKNNIEKNGLLGVACTAYNYHLKKTVSFMEAHPSVTSWTKQKRVSQSVQLSTDHILASCAIPVVFEPVNVNGHYYGDGSLRNQAPISPILHLGANKVIFIGVRYRHLVESMTPQKPTIGEIFGTILNGLFFDTTDIDVERLDDTNHYVDRCHENGAKTNKKKISYIYIRPSVDLAEVARDLAPQFMPAIVNYLLQGLGSPKDYAELASYLLFDASYTSKLIDVGYEDAQKNKDSVRELLEG